MATPVVIFRFADYTAQIPEIAKASIPPFFTAFNPGGGDNWHSNTKFVLENTSKRGMQQNVEINIVTTDSTSGTVQFTPETDAAFEAQFTIEMELQP